MSNVELLIKVPEDLYKAAVNGLVAANEIWDLKLAVANGTPLPKGHGRLIDADKIRIRRSSDSIIEPNVEMAIQAVKQYIDQLPTIIESEDEK